MLELATLPLTTQPVCLLSGSRLREDAVAYTNLCATHQVGYPGHSAARAWLLRRMQQLGVDAEQQDVLLPGRQFLNESCSIVLRNGSEYRCRALWLPQAGRVVLRRNFPVEILEARSQVELTGELTADIQLTIARGARAVIVASP